MPTSGAEDPGWGVRAGETVADLLVRVDSQTGGLASNEAARRLLEQGANEPAVARGRSLLLDFLRAVANPLALILIAASIGSAVLGEVTNAVIIITIVLASAALNFVQAFRSQAAVQRLHGRIAPQATVLRDGRWQEVARREVVLGDWIRLAAGDLVPADARLVESHDLHVQQAALTGESLPAEKSVGPDALEQLGAASPDLVFVGTSVVSGTATAVVFATGSHTAFGDIVARLAARPEETELERGTRRFGMLILETVVFLVLFVLVVNLSLKRDPLESLLFAVALAVGLTPEFLPMIVTVTLARGALRMARRKVIVKHLPAIHNLGSVDVLCSDKTGTITAGSMSLDASLGPFGESWARTLEVAALNSRFQTGVRSALDAAIVAEAGEQGAGYRKTDEIPFDFERRRLSVVLAADGRGFTLITKGAPEGMLAACSRYETPTGEQPLDPQARRHCEATFLNAGEHGLRVLAVAQRPVGQGAGFTVADERDLTLVGFLTFADHLLPEAARSLTQMRQHGVAVKILTGDNEWVTRAVCRQAGVDTERIVLGDEVQWLSEPALARVAEEVSVFARLSPAQKHRIVQALQHHGHVVGFLGDGINDAPSLHGADVGISVAGAVDVAQEAADLILLEHNLDVLHAGIVEGRKAFGNVLKYLLMGTSSNFGNVFSMAGGVLFLPFLPMLPTQILLNNFLYDLAQVTIPTDRVDPVYTRRPQRWDIRIIRDFMLLVGPVSSLFDAVTFVVLLRLFHFGAGSFQTGWFVESLATQTLVLFVIRTVGRPWAQRPSTPLAVTTLAVVAVAVALPFSPLAGLLGMRPLPGAFFAFLASVVVVYLALVQLVKQRLMRRLLQPH